VRGFAHSALTISLAAALLGGCGSQLLIGRPGAMPQTLTIAAGTSNTNYKIVYNFGGGRDGASPRAGLIYVGGTLYGTTVAGGDAFYCSYYYGCGTVFSITPGGTEKVLHVFGSGSDGENPRAGLIDVGGTLYGTTTYGGSNACDPYYANCGTVFSITPSGAEKVLHSFSGPPNDGTHPVAGLINIKGTLYGTTARGGLRECYYPGYSGETCGTVFSITTTGAKGVLHNFTGSPDGEFPRAGLVEVKGTLYGTTSTGGKHGYGTVFSITPGGKEKVLHSFAAGSDGRNPDAGLVELKGKLYGTTFAGGPYTCSPYNGCGTVFSVTLGGKEKVLHSFGAGSDGTNPDAGLIELKGKLYGTTTSGGAVCGGGCGTVFSITPSGAEKVLHSYAFGGGSPYAGLIDVKGTLYGTTSEGGANGYGTVFSLKP
jgi:uncharacterized repeat protein (TIGR03803 family)